MRVLIAEDDLNIRKGLREILEAEGYEVLEAATGAEALDLFKSKSPEFICLDIMMPERSGYDVCREIRAADSEIPIIFISAKSEEIDKVLGLELGADDYILKPFGIKEVVARIRAVTRRCLKNSTATPTETFQMGDLLVAPRELRVKRDSTVIDVSLREIKILELLKEHQGKAVDKNLLLDRCWGTSYFPNSRTLEQTISNLRKKIEIDPKAPKIISTVHGVGYRYDG